MCFIEGCVKKNLIANQRKLATKVCLEVLLRKSATPRLIVNQNEFSFMGS